LTTVRELQVKKSYLQKKTEKKKAKGGGRIVRNVGLPFNAVDVGKSWGTEKGRTRQVGGGVRVLVEKQW